MTKSKIRPPRTPRGEDPKVTIANQDRQIKVLIDRTMQLTDDVAQASKARDEARSGLADEMKHVRQLRAALESSREACNRLLGWQDCAREMLEATVPPEFREV